MGDGRRRLEMGDEAAGPRTEATGNGNTEGDLKNATPAE